MHDDEGLLNRHSLRLELRGVVGDSGSKRSATSQGLHQGLCRAMDTSICSARHFGLNRERARARDARQRRAERGIHGPALLAPRHSWNLHVSDGHQMRLTLGDGGLENPRERCRAAG